MHVELTRQEDVPPLDAELPPMEAHHLDPTTGEDEFALEAASAGPAAAPRQCRAGASAKGDCRRRCGGEPEPGRSFDLGQGAA